MQLYYDYILTSEEALSIKKHLRLKCYVEVVNITFDYIITPVIPATFYSPEEGGELIVKEMTINYLAGEDGVPIVLHQRDREIVCDLLDSEKLDDVCYDNWEEPNYDNFEDFNDEY